MERIETPNEAGVSDGPDVTEEEMLAGLRHWFGSSADEEALPPLPDDPRVAARQLAEELRSIDGRASGRRTHRTPKQEKRAWTDSASDLPGHVRGALERVRTVGLRFAITKDFEHRKFGWVNGHRRVRRGGVEQMTPVDRIERARAWSRAFSGLAASTNMSDLKVLIDNWIAPIHQGQVLQGRWPDELPASLKNVKVVNGALTIDEARNRKDFPGVASFFEQTPPELFVLDARAVRSRFTRLALAWGQPGAWDSTAGSGTGAAALHPLGWHVVSTDLTNPAEQVKFLDARNLGASPYHHRPVKIGGKQVPPAKIKEAEIVIRPHLIFLDVSSRGTPTHAEEYGQGINIEHDFASLRRPQLVEDVAAVVVHGLGLLNRGGCFSLTVREAWRSGGRIVPDLGLTNDILNAITQKGGSYDMVEDYRVIYRNPRNQASTGSSRAPIRHVLLGRTS